MLTLLILDGYGEGEQNENNAIFMAETPEIDRLRSVYPTTTLAASGIEVGLIPGQIGNSEVGHMNIGAGRILYQDLARINNAIEDKSIKKNKVLNDAILHAKHTVLHFIGLLSDGGVHSHIEHLKAMIDYASSCGVEKIYIHAITDGRDVLRDSANKYLQQIISLSSKKNVKIASVIGRVYAMDREKRYDRLKIAYDLFVSGSSKIQVPIENLQNIIKEEYKKGIYDEFLPAIKIEGTENVKDGDSVVFFNYRTDRAREISEAFICKDYKHFETVKFSNLFYAGMTYYDKSFENFKVLFPPVNIEKTLSMVLSEAGVKQFKVTESTKYAHVTFFFNGGIEEPYPGEERHLVESYNVKDFSDFPEMKAEEITQKAVEAINGGKYDFILINLSNPDMIGHTGNMEACKVAIKKVDDCTGRIVKACLSAGGMAIVTADHGNAEIMKDASGNVITAHTTNKVPFILCSDSHKDIKLKSGGKLANIAPTILKLMNLTQPVEMESEALF